MLPSCFLCHLCNDHLWGMRLHKSWVIYVIYDGAFFSHTVDRASLDPSCGREEAEEVENGGREWGAWGRNWMRGTERNWGEPQQQNFFKLDNRLASLLLSPHGCWVPAKITSAVYISGGESGGEGGSSAWKNGSYNKDQVTQENTAISFNPTSRDDNTKW